MRLAILRRAPKASVSMDVYANAIVRELKALYPNWEIFEVAPGRPELSGNQYSLVKGLQKYYERFWRYPQSLKDLEVDVAHIIDHTDGYLVNRLQKLGIPSVVTCHDIVNLVRPDWFQEQAAIPHLSMAVWKHAVRSMAKADRICTVSHYTAKDLSHYLHIPPQQIAVTPNGVDSTLGVLPKFEWINIRRQWGLSDTTFCLLNVGSNNPRKNILSILKSVLSLSEQGMPVHFWKAGDDFVQEDREFIELHKLGNKVTYLGKPDQLTLKQIYNAADALLAPSIYEGFGLTVLEAMACGTPVITSNITSLPEVAGEAAILIDPLDIEAMVKAVIQLINDPDLRQDLASKGLVRIPQFTWKKTAEKLAAVYQDVFQKA